MKQNFFQEILAFPPIPTPEKFSPLRLSLKQRENSQ